MDIPDRINQRERAREQFGELVGRMAYWMRRGDRLADAVIEATRGWSRVRLLRTVETAIRDGTDAVDDAPDELVRLVDQVSTVPAWVERDCIEHGGDFFLSTHVAGSIVLGGKSLVTAYADPAGNKPLVLSGRLRDGTHRRLAETGRFIYDVSKPGGLEPGGDGIVSAVTVRLMHAHVRHMIDRKADWNPEWGAPINQHDMMWTLLLFSLLLVEGLETLGIEPTEREIANYMALWRYVGYLMGIAPELLPATRSEAERYADFVELTMGEPDEDSRELTRHFLQPEHGHFPADPRKSAHFTFAAVRMLLGDELADHLDIPSSPVSSVLPALRHLVRPINRLRQTPAGFRTALRAGERYWEWVLDREADGLVDFTIPGDLFGLDRRAG